MVGVFRGCPQGPECGSSLDGEKEIEMYGDPVLVTGCSSGIGKATVQALVRAGHTVYGIR